jgi:peptide/nickel transport system substrate-binding protein
MRMRRPTTVRLLAAVAVAGVGISMAGCAADPGDTKDNNKTAFVFAGAGDPTSLDPSLASDGETFRVTRQVFETLLTHERGGSKIVGGLAEKWDNSEDGTEWSFTLRDGVKFSDGEALTAQVVCDNFDRWYNWEGNYQSSAISSYWQDTFGGFAKNGDRELPDPNYKSCDAADDLNLTIKVNKSSARLPGGFTLQSMAIHSPKALAGYEKQDIQGDSDDALTYPDYSQEAGTAVGSGPYVIKEWDHGNNEVTLVRNDDYWGEKAKIKTIVIKTIPAENDRKQALLSGDIDGYDLVAPQDVDALKDEGMEVPTRDPFNLMYLGMNQKKDGKDTPLADHDVREAIAHAIDKKKILDQVYPPGSEVATQFLAPALDGWSKDVPEYEFDTDKAKELLKKAGEEDLTIDVCYPTDVTRPYMPAPDSIFENIKADLENVGVKVEANAMTWAPDYLDKTAAGACSLYILGWTGDYNEAYNFIGTWFGSPDPAWGFNEKEIFDALDAVDAEPDPAKRVPMYEEANNTIMEFIPGVPISHSSPSIAFASYVNPPTTSPLTAEDFAEISFK